MIDFISIDDLRKLAEATDRYCVSIYLPTHATGNEMAQDPIRFKNLLAEATGREMMRSKPRPWDGRESSCQNCPAEEDELPPPPIVSSSPRCFR